MIIPFRNYKGQAFSKNDYPFSTLFSNFQRRISRKLAWAGNCNWSGLVINNYHSFGDAPSGAYFGFVVDRANLVFGGNMPNHTKHELIVAVSGMTGLTQEDTRIVVEELLEEISKLLEEGNTIEIRGFGTFYTKIRKPRPARNPKTGEVVPLPRRVVPLFRYSKELKQELETALKPPLQNSLGNDN